MNTRRYKHGVSLIEIVIVVGVIALLATMAIGIAARIDNQSKEKGLEGTFALLEGALQEYHEFTDGFPKQPERIFANAPAHSEYLYSELSSIPSSRKILEKINDSLIRHNFDTGAIPPVPEIYDPWGTVLDYVYGPNDTFPKLTSAGPDKNFGTSGDNITNK
jgi:prepilin-type N-terminal cleavage/methylation domain-containing protein